MPARPLHALLLAAGLGTRMKSTLPKVMHPVAGRPMVGHVLDRAFEAGADAVTVVTGHGRDQVEAWITGAFPDHAIAFRRQERMLGTADAVRSAADRFAGTDDDVLILYGDVPGLPADALRAVVDLHRAGDGPLTLLSAHDTEEHGYGRIVRAPDGSAARIVEFKDASPAERAITEVNVGVYCVQAGFLTDALTRMDDQNAAGEFYLTDLVAIAAAAGTPARIVVADTIDALHGVNTRVQLAEAERQAQRRIATKWMLAGATLHNPDSTWIDEGVMVGRDVVLEPGVTLRGNTRLEDGVHVESGVRLEDVTVPAGTRVRAPRPG